MNIGINPSANSVKQKQDVSLETSVCFHIARLMNNQTKSRKNNYSPKRRESHDTNAVAIVKSVSQLVVYHKIQMHWFLKVESLGETRCRRSWNQFEGYDSQSLRYVKQVSGKRKDHLLKKYKSKIVISEVPTL